MAQPPIRIDARPADRPQPVAAKRTTSRRRISSINRGAQDLIDATVEARGTTEEPSREFEVTRPDVQDLFAIRTRRMLRKLEGELRSLRAQIDGRRAA